MPVGSALASAFLWLADKIGSRQLDKLLEGESEKTIRMLQRALLESQDRRSELEDLSVILDRIEAQRDALQDRVVQLMVERNDLREALSACQRQLPPE